MAKTLTPNYSLGKWDLGDNPGNVDLNLNWTLIDTGMRNADLMSQTYDYEEQMDVNLASSFELNKPQKVKTASYAITYADILTTFNNSGAGAQVIFTLPSVAALLGMRFTFVVLAAQNVRLACSGTDQIRVAASISTASTGHVDNATVGGVITLEAVASGLWIATSTQGTWTVT